MIMHTGVVCFRGVQVVVSWFRLTQRRSGIGQCFAGAVGVHVRVDGSLASHW
jgi:hypothetical protein